MALRPSTHKKKGLEKIVLEEEKNNALCQLNGLRVTDSLGGGIDSQKEIDLWLLHHPLLRRKADREKDSSRFTDFWGANVLVDHYVWW